MSKRNVIRCILAILMLVYLVVILPIVWHQSAHSPLNRLSIEVIDPDSVGFVSVDDIDRELGYLSKSIAKTPRDSISTLDIQRKLRSLDKIEDANAIILSDGTLRITVKPMRPVARVIDPANRIPSYYINSEGKRILADIRYRIDVPIVQAVFGPSFPAADIIPLLRYIDRNPDINDLVSSVSVDPSGDIIIVPAISGHVINIGDTCDLDNKFRRLKVFYRNVMPEKGWDYYDTISVKWARQVVAKQSRQTPPPPPVQLIDDGSTENDDDATMDPDGQP